MPNLIQRILDVNQVSEGIVKPGQAPGDKKQIERLKAILSRKQRTNYFVKLLFNNNIPTIPPTS